MKTRMPSLQTQLRWWALLLLLSSTLAGGCAGSRKLSFSRLWGPDRFKMKPIGRNIADRNQSTETTKSRGDRLAKAGPEAAKTQRQPETPANKSATGTGNVFASFGRRQFPDQELVEDPFLAAYEQPESKQGSVLAKLSATIDDDISKPMTELNPFADLRATTLEGKRPPHTDIAPPTKPNPFAEFSSQGDQLTVSNKPVPTQMADPFVGGAASQIERLRVMMKENVDSTDSFDIKKNQTLHTKLPLPNTNDRLKEVFQNGDSKRMAEAAPTAKRPAGSGDEILGSASQPAGNPWARYSVENANSDYDAMEQALEWARPKPQNNKNVEPLETVFTDFRKEGDLSKKKNSGQSPVEIRSADQLSDIKIVPTPRNRMSRAFGLPSVFEEDSHRVEFISPPPQEQKKFGGMIVTSDAVHPRVAGQRTAGGSAIVHTNLPVPILPASVSPVCTSGWTALSSNRGRSLDHELTQTSLNMDGNFTDIGSRSVEPLVPAAQPNKGKETVEIEPRVSLLSSAANDSAQMTLKAVNFDVETEPGTDSAEQRMISPTTIGLSLGVLSLIGLALRWRMRVRVVRTV